MTPILKIYPQHIWMFIRACIELMRFKISKVCITLLDAVLRIDDGLPDKMNMK